MLKCIVNPEIVFLKILHRLSTKRSLRRNPAEKLAPDTAEIVIYYSIFILSKSENRYKLLNHKFPKHKEHKMCSETQGVSELVAQAERDCRTHQYKQNSERTGSSESRATKGCLLDKKKKKNTVKKNNEGKRILIKGKVTTIAQIRGHHLPCSRNVPSAQT